MNPKIKKKIEGPFNRALELSREGHHDLAIQILSGIAQEYPKFAGVFGVMGNIYRKIGDLENAIRCFQKTVDLSPLSELASLGLFQSLQDANRKNEAIAEMRRFLSIARSEEYNRFLQDINKSLQDDPRNYLEMTNGTSSN